MQHCTPQILCRTQSPLQLNDTHVLITVYLYFLLQLPASFLSQFPQQNNYIVLQTEIGFPIPDYKGLLNIPSHWTDNSVSGISLSELMFFQTPSFGFHITLVDFHIQFTYHRIKIHTHCREYLSVLCSDSVS